MRTIGMLVAFGLGICSLVEGAYLVKLSRDVKGLADELRLTQEAGGAERAAVAVPALHTAPLRVVREVARPRDVPPAFVVSTPAPTTQAATTLHEALATAEGREQLKNALAIIDEERRQDKVGKRVEKQEGHNQQLKEKIAKVVALNGDESYKLDTLLAGVQAERHQLVEDMKVGLKNAREVDDQLDTVDTRVDKEVRALLGDERWKKLREQDRRGRGGNQGPPGPR